MLERPVLRLDVIEVGQSLQVGAQMRSRQPALKTRPAACLRLVAPPDSIEHIDPRILPFEFGPTALPELGRFDRLPSLFRATRPEQSLGDTCGDLWHLPRLFVILADESINVALGVSDLLQRQAGSTPTRAL